MEKLYFGGMPTGADIQKIRESYPDEKLETGHLIPYESIEEIIKENRKTNRFASVTDRWRKLVEKQTGQIIGCEPGVGFKILSNGEKVGLARQKLATSGRMIRRSCIVSSRVDVSQLTDQEKTEHTFNETRAAMLRQTARLKPKSELPTLAPAAPSAG